MLIGVLFEVRIVQQAVVRKLFLVFPEMVPEHRITSSTVRGGAGDSVFGHFR